MITFSRTDCKESYISEIIASCVEKHCHTQIDNFFIQFAADTAICSFLIFIENNSNESILTRNYAFRSEYVPQTQSRRDIFWTKEPN